MTDTRLTVTAKVQILGYLRDECGIWPTPLEHFTQCLDKVPTDLLRKYADERFMARQR